jgi:hypothetical protein
MSPAGVTVFDSADSAKAIIHPRTSSCSAVTVRRVRCGYRLVTPLPTCRQPSSPVALKSQTCSKRPPTQDAQCLQGPAVVARAPYDRRRARRASAAAPPPRGEGQRLRGAIRGQSAAGGPRAALTSAKSASIRPAGPGPVPEGPIPAAYGFSSGSRIVPVRAAHGPVRNPRRADRVRADSALVQEPPARAASRGYRPRRDLAARAAAAGPGVCRGPVLATQRCPDVGAATCATTSSRGNRGHGAVRVRGAARIPGCRRPAYRRRRESGPVRRHAVSAARAGWWPGGRAAWPKTPPLGAAGCQPPRRAA